MTAMDRITTALAAPKTHEVVTTYACGKVSRFPTRCAKSAEMHAAGDRRKIGRDLISRNADMTAGPIVRVISVEVRAI